MRNTYGFNRQPGVVFFHGSGPGEAADIYKGRLIRERLSPDDGMSNDLRQILAADSATHRYKHLGPDETYVFPNSGVLGLYTALDNNPATHDRAQLLKGKSGDTRSGCAADPTIADALAIVRSNDLRRIVSQKVGDARKAAAMIAASQQQQTLHVAARTTVVQVFGTYGATGAATFAHFNLHAQQALFEDGADFETVGIAIGAAVAHGTDASVRYGNTISVMNQLDFAQRHPDEVEIPTLARALRLPPGRRMFDRLYYVTNKNGFIRLGTDRAPVMAAVARIVWHLLEGGYAPLATEYYRDHQPEFDREARTLATIGLSILRWEPDRARRWVELRGTQLICEQILAGRKSIEAR